MKLAALLAACALLAASLAHAQTYAGRDGGLRGERPQRGAPAPETPAASATESVTQIFAGSAAGFSGSQDGTGTAALFNNPTGIAADAQGNIYVVDQGNFTVRRISGQTQQVTTLAGASGVIGVVNATGTQAEFAFPTKIAVDTDGNCYVTDNHSLIRMITPTGTVSTLAGSGQVGNVNGTGEAAQFSDPQGLALDEKGNIIVADTNNNTLREVVIATGAVSTLSSTGQTNTVTLSESPTAMQSITVFIGETLTINLPSTTSSTTASGATYQWYQNGAPLINQTSSSLTLTVADSTSAGSYYVIESTLIGSSTSAVQSSTLNVAVQAFTAPAGVAVSSTGGIFVSETGQSTISSTSNGVVAGVPGQSGYIDGIGATAQFNLPKDMSIDADDNLYVADTGNNAIRKITPYGFVMTVACAVPPSPNVNFQETPPVSIALHSPNSLTIDNAGNLFIADTLNNCIRKLVLPPTIPTALTASVVSASGFTANWTAVPGADPSAHPSSGYYLSVATDQAFKNEVSGFTHTDASGSTANGKDVGNTQSYVVSGISGTPYYYQVAAYNVAGTGLASNAIAVVTVATPVATAVSNMTTSTSTTSGTSSTISFVLNWTAASGALGYQVDLSTSSDFTSFVTGFNSLDVGNVLSYAVTSVPSGTYYFRVRALYSSLVSSNSNTVSTALVTAPVAVAATNVFSDVSNIQFTANWDSVPGGTAYYIDVSLDSAFGSFVLNNVNAGNNLSYVVTNLKAGTAYYYRVRALSTGGTASTISANSNVITVTTQSLSALDSVGNKINGGKGGGGGAPSLWYLGALALIVALRLRQLAASRRTA